MEKGRARLFNERQSPSRKGRLIREDLFSEAVRASWRGATGNHKSQENQTQITGVRADSWGRIIITRKIRGSMKPIDGGLFGRSRREAPRSLGHLTNF